MDPDTPPPAPVHVWRPEFNPVAVVLAAPAKTFTAGHRRIDLSRSQIRSDRIINEMRYMVIAEASGAHRLCLIGPPALEKPLIALIPVTSDVTLRLEATQRLQRHLAGLSAGPPPHGWGLTIPQRTRLSLMLRAIDAWQAGKSHRQIALDLLDPDGEPVSATAWKVSSVRARTMRLIADGLDLMRGGYLRLLKGVAG